MLMHEKTCMIPIFIYLSINSTLTYLQKQLDVNISPTALPDSVVIFYVSTYSNSTSVAAQLPPNWSTDRLILPCTCRIQKVLSEGIQFWQVFLIFFLNFLFVDEARREDPNNTKNGLLSAHQRNAFNGVSLAG